MAFGEKKLKKSRREYTSSYHFSRRNTRARPKLILNASNIKVFIADNSMLIEKFSKEEVWEAVTSCDSFKSLEPRRI